MTDEEEIEFNRVLEALDIAKRRLRELIANPKLLALTDVEYIWTLGDPKYKPIEWAQNVLAEIEEAEGNVL